MRFLSVNLDKLEFCGQVAVGNEQTDKIFLQNCKENIVFLSFPNSVGWKNGKKTEG